METITLYEGDPESRMEIPARYEVCSRCEGRGVHDHEAFSNGITSEEMYEAGEDFREDYFAGRYNVTCRECSGDRVVLVIDENRSTPEQIKEYNDFWQAEWDYRAMAEAERRAGC